MIRLSLFLLNSCKSAAGIWMCNFQPLARVGGSIPSASEFKQWMQAFGKFCCITSVLCYTFHIDSLSFQISWKNTGIAYLKQKANKRQKTTTKKLKNPTKQPPNPITQTKQKDVPRNQNRCIHTCKWWDMDYLVFLLMLMVSVFIFEASFKTIINLCAVIKFELAPPCIAESLGVG